MAMGRIGRKAGAEPGDAKAETYLDQGCELVGALRFKENVRIDGSVEGEIEAAKTVIIGETANVEATIRAEAVEVHGTVKGDIRVRRKVILHETARVTGEIRTAGIVVEEGARFKGCIVIGSEDAAAGAKPDDAIAPTPAEEDRILAA